MNSQSITALAVIFVAVSVVSLTVQVVALSKLFAWPTVITSRGTLVYRGMLRTSLCRVLAALTYVVIGTVILINQAALPILSLTVFSSVQILWMANAVADVQLRRRLATLDSLQPRPQFRGVHRQH